MTGAGGWQLGPFTRRPAPILGSSPGLAWATKDLFNPGAVVHDGAIHLVVRGEDAVGRFAGTSRIGLARSTDGVTFEIEPEPVLGPDDGPYRRWEQPGGCEDPRVVESPDGGFVCLYTGFDGRVATLMAATSTDLRVWEKTGPVFAGTDHASRWSKSGAIVTEARDGRLVAARIDGRFVMYWGEKTCFAAESDDLLHWSPLEFDATEGRFLTYTPGPSPWTVHRVAGQRVLRPVLFPRPGRFDSLLVEPGPPAVRTAAGIVLLYNGANHPRRGDPAIAAGAYLPGQALLDPLDPFACIARDVRPFLSLETDTQFDGQVPNVCFIQGLVLFNGAWWLYFGMGDSRIGCATAPAREVEHASP